MDIPVQGRAGGIPPLPLSDRTPPSAAPDAAPSQRATQADSFVRSRQDVPEQALQAAPGTLAASQEATDQSLAAQAQALANQPAPARQPDSPSDPQQAQGSAQRAPYGLPGPLTGTTLNVLA